MFLLRLWVRFSRFNLAKVQSRKAGWVQGGQGRGGGGGGGGLPLIKYPPARKEKIRSIFWLTEVTDDRRQATNKKYVVLVCNKILPQN